MHPFDLLPLPTGAGIIFTPAPGTKGTTVTEAIATLAETGATALITMMLPEEMTEFNVAAIPQACAAYNLAWYHLPVEDDCAPEEAFHKAWQQMGAELIARINNNETVVIHCRGGTGRTGMLAAVLLLESGIDWPEVVRLIRSVREKSLRLTPHLDYLEQQYGVDRAIALA